MTIPMNDFADKVFSKFGVSTIGLYKIHKKNFLFHAK